MKYFIDFEFIEGFHKPMFSKRRHFIDMISIGIVSEDNRGLYFLSSEYNYKDADDWVKKNVIIPAYIKEVHGDMRNSVDARDFQKVVGYPIGRIAQEVIKWIGKDSNISFYGYYSDYDWVLFCSMFGRMIDLPKGFPMYCIDLKQSLDEKVAKLTNSDFLTHFHVETPLSFKEKLELVKTTNINYPQQNNEHHALHDAKWNKDLYEFLQTI